MSKNKEHLEEMLKHLINKDEDKARLAFHQFIVDSARQIHESIVAEDELDAEIDEDVKSDFDDIKQEEYYGKEDLRDAEEMDSEDVSPDAAEDELMGDEETVDAEED